MAVVEEEARVAVQATDQTEDQVPLLQSSQYLVYREQTLPTLDIWNSLSWQVHYF
jgi:hypothetical protein